MFKIILSGGGTGGHIYPAVSVAEALTKKYGADVKILFVGAEGKMEMERVPALGYDIVGLPVAGLQRSLSLKNLSLPIKIIKSLTKARKIIKKFKPDIVVGFGGYASAPILWSAQQMGVSTVIQEQNSYAGVTNKLLARKAKRICVAYSGMERFFAADKIIMTGNPLRGNFGDIASKREEAFKYFGLNPEKPTVMIVGGSLGTRTLNNAVLKYLDSIIEKNEIQLIWQTGKFYQCELDKTLCDKVMPNIWRGAFIERMDYAYSIADVVISRAGASTVSELCLLGKPTIFVPSPNVAEDHQTKNAEALSSIDAAILIPDNKAVESVIPSAIELAKDSEKLALLSKNIKNLAINDSADRIVNVVECFLNSI